MKHLKILGRGLVRLIFMAFILLAAIILFSIVIYLGEKHPVLGFTIAIVIIILTAAYLLGDT